jgi:hypothetical protein
MQTHVVLVHSYAHVSLQYTFPSRTIPFPGGTVQKQRSQAHFTAWSMTSPRSLIFPPPAHPVKPLDMQPQST